MKPLLKSALTAVTLSSAIVALAACASGYYRTGYYSRGYVYDRPAYVVETQPSYVVTMPGYVVANPPATVVAQSYGDNCTAIYHPDYCSYPRYGGTVMINGIAYTGLHFRDGRFGREFWFDGTWHRIA
jgi:hypothetical protein